jgi:ketosteroid isomerase-like protein
MLFTEPDHPRMGPGLCHRGPSRLTCLLNHRSEAMTKSCLLSIACLSLLAACAAVAQESAPNPAGQQVADTERAFAQTMADRDFEAFTSFLSDETVFFAGNTPLRGKQQVADAWKRYFDGPDAPFSWEPELVEVLASGTLALSSGPVRDPAGNRVATFNSIWRLGPDGQWRIVFDKGSPDCPKPEPEDTD